MVDAENIEVVTSWFWDYDKTIQVLADQMLEQFGSVDKYKIIYDCKKIFEDIASDIEKHYGLDQQ